MSVASYFVEIYEKIIVLYSSSVVLTGMSCLTTIACYHVYSSVSLSLCLETEIPTALPRELISSWGIPDRVTLTPEIVESRE